MAGPATDHNDDHSSSGSVAHQPEAHSWHRAFVAWGCTGSIVIALAALAAYLPAFTHGHQAHSATAAPPGWVFGSLPFVLLLLAIAILPLIPTVSHWWHQNLNKLAISLLAGCVTLGYLAVADSPGAAALAANHAVLHEFVPFIVLLLSLYVICGNIHVSGDLVAEPHTTTGFLLVGAMIASVVGTTGASMLLIRPLLSTISERKYRVHTVIFFIFIVSNIGGTLLPIGDPPLFMGYLMGVPFFWTLTLWQEWLFCVVALLLLHYVIDSILWRREPTARLLLDRVRVIRLRSQGLHNLLFLGIVVSAVAFIDPSRPLPLLDVPPPPYTREAILLFITGVSYALTSRRVREANRFSFGAIGEVAVIFIGIFVAMQVPLVVLRAHGAELGLTTPTHFFWVTGALSSFLDNAPTYLVFLETASVVPKPTDASLISITTGGQVPVELLTAVSLGAVFMGANTYIGNGPNFMVRSIAEESGVRMPSFFGYMLWSGAILLPLFVAVDILFI